MNAPLDGKVAVVIGGTSGIGRALAHGLAEGGADVVPTGRRAELVDANAASFVTGAILNVDGGYLASGVNR